MSEKDTGFLAGAVLGAAIGFLLGILFAPAPGEQTREYLKEKSKEAADEVKVKGQEIAEVAISKIKDVLKQGAKNLKEETDEIH